MITVKHGSLRFCRGKCQDKFDRRANAPKTGADNQKIEINYARAVSSTESAISVTREAE